MSGSSERRGAEGETQLAAVAFSSSDIISSNFLLVSCKEVTLLFPLLEASRHYPKQAFHSVCLILRLAFSSCACKIINFGILKEYQFGHFKLGSPLV